MTPVIATRKPPEDRYSQSATVARPSRRCTKDGSCGPLTLALIKAPQVLRAVPRTGPTTPACSGLRAVAITPVGTPQRPNSADTLCEVGPAQSKSPS